MGVWIYVLAFALIMLGVYAVVAKKNLVKIIIGVLLIDYGVNLLLVLFGYRSGGEAPIVSKGETIEHFTSTSVDALPQAMVLTSIVISLGLTALMVVMAIRLYEKYKTFDTNEMRKLRG